ncbi:MAG: thioredoxin family protein [Phycisphaerales bacterium]
MMRITVLLLISVACLLTGVSRAPAAEPPEIFDKRPYADARKAATESKKWFIVKGTADWCPPCKQMDRTTWVDPKVVKWAKEHAIIVAVDVDAQPELAQDLGIEAMPTMIAFKEGSKEFDRIVGYRDAADFLAWLEGIDRGEKSIEAAKRRVAGNEGEEKVDVSARLDLARELSRTRQYTEAADEYAWLWKNMLQHEPSMYGVRLSFMSSDMRSLAKRSVEARAKFAALRDELSPKVREEKVAPEELVDWLSLNKVIDDSKATLEWFDRVKGEPRWKALLSRASRDIEDMLIDAGRWADLPALHPDPIADLKAAHQFFRLMPETPAPKGMDEETAQMLADTRYRIFRDQAARLYAGLLAADKPNDAAALAEKARELDDSAGMLKRLVATALKAGQARSQHGDWLRLAQDKLGGKKDVSYDEPTIAELQESLAAALKAGDTSTRK